jgi:undecaprenyl-diphosphatase
MNYVIIFGAKYLYLVAAIIAIGYFFSLPRDKRRSFFLFSIIDFISVYLVGLFAGYLYNNPRPFVSDGITPLISHAANNGFPSDHTLLTAAFASIIYCYNKKLGIILFIISVLVGLSRVFAGIHHYVDILGSLIIAIVITYIVYKFSEKIHR